MKINKVLFSTSVEYSDFWNINSKVFKTKLGFEPICLLFGDRNRTDMSEEYGKIIEIPVLPQYNRILQITWSKFYFPISEPDTTWLIGDIDMLPLQTDWFVKNIETVPDDAYVHLNAGGGCAQMGMTPDHWLKHGGIIDGGCDLVGHYHVAKGSTFKKALEHNGTFEDELNYLITSKKYGLGHYNNSFKNDMFYWCAEEHRTTELLRKNTNNGLINFFGFVYNVSNNHDRVDRGSFNPYNNDYTYDREKLINNKFVDVHCMRPYKQYATQNENLLKLANMI